jgi:hypothetical protein
LADAQGTDRHEDRAMATRPIHSRKATPEERTFFEKLLSLRATYGTSPADAEPAISVHHAIAAANAVMGAAPTPRAARFGAAAN